MRVTEHVELLLRQGRKTKELLDLGFPKAVITRVRRRLRNEGLSPRTRTSKVQAGRQIDPQTSLASAAENPPVQPRLESLERRLQQLQTRVDEELQKLVDAVQQIENRIKGTPALGLKDEFRCSCGASGFVAIGIKCTQCGRETYWGWWPKKE